MLSTSTTATTTSSSVKSAERTLSILSYLASKNAPVPCMTIARACALPRSSTYHLLNVLLERDFVIHYPDRRRWGLGAAVVPIADAFRRSRPLPWLGSELFDDLVGGDVLAASLHGLAGSTLSMCAHRTGDRVARVDPVADPAHREAAALALASASKVEESRQLLRRLGQEASALRFLEGLDGEARRGREHGYVARVGVEEGVTHLAAPVVDDHSSPRAALVLACRTKSAFPDATLVEHLLAAARTLSASFAPRLQAVA